MKVSEKPPPVIAELFAFVAFSGKAIDLPRLTHLAASASVARASALMVHGQTFRAIDLN